ncbi:SnoaL-like protein [Actinocorallia herbida]|uniref:SnoaL-like protein n=1 Tax=Actinocorallia herbida TaxID=58109 RepID=A0A3N1D424_9ACTN|nr:nuclear transport factor 2 family protein [Actinocorallia herbida]ROO88284.1 SnoaL-like protein [Actinocorallia herbida]
MDASPAALVDRYLQLCEDRALDEATALLAPGARIVFPGGRVHTSLHQMAGAASGHYTWVRKHRERYFEGTGADGAVVVTSLGSLYGEDLDGAPFSGIRYADVFVLRDGLIVEQNVFNDLPEAGIIRIPSAGGASA